jgi:hypothetical protein
MRGPLRFASVAALRAEALAYPHLALQPRHAARRHVVFTPRRVEAVRYDANEQCLVAALTDDDGETLILQRTHGRHTRHALDAIAAALDGRFGPLRHVAGTLSWQDGTPHLEPWALACDRLVVPDCEAHIGALREVELGRVSERTGDACTRSLDSLGRHLAMALHQGLRRLPARWQREGEDLERALTAAGLQALSQQLHVFQSAVAAEGARTAAAARAFMTLAALRQLHLDAIETQRAETASAQASSI